MVIGCSLLLEDRYSGVRKSFQTLINCSTKQVTSVGFKRGSITWKNSRVELANNSLISTRYSIHGNPSGVVALITPLRTDYSKNISILECVAECAGELIDELIETKQE